MRNFTIFLLSLLFVISSFSQVLAKGSMPKADDKYHYINYTVKSGDGLIRIYRKHYTGKATKTRYTEMASWNNNQAKAPDFMVKVGQRLKLRILSSENIQKTKRSDKIGNVLRIKRTTEKILVKQLKDKNSIVMIERALEVSKNEINELIPDASNLGLVIPSTESVEKHLKKAKPYTFLKELVLVSVENDKVSLGKTVTGLANRECRVIDIVIAEYYDIRVMQCIKNDAVYTQLTKRANRVGTSFVKWKKKQAVIVYPPVIEKQDPPKPSRVLRLLEPPKPPPKRRRPPEPPIFLEPKLLDVITFKAFKSHFNFSTGQFFQDYDDGASDVSTWIYSRYAQEFFSDDLGVHSFGVGLNGSYWSGVWNDPINPNSSEYNFSGIFLNPHLEYRILDENDREWYVNVGWVFRKDKGSRVDQWGTYITESRYDGQTINIGFDDNSRYNELFLSRIQFSVGRIEATSVVRESYYNNVKLDEEPVVIDAWTGKLNLDLLNIKDRLIVLSLNTWWQYTDDNVRTIKFVPMIAFFGNSLKIGVEKTLVDWGYTSAIGFGFAWEIDFYNLYEFMTEEEKKNELSFKSIPDDVFINYSSDDDTNSADGIFLSPVD